MDVLGGKFDIHGRIEEVMIKKNPFVSERINIDDVFYEIGVYPVLHSNQKQESQMLSLAVLFSLPLAEANKRAIRVVR